MSTFVAGTVAASEFEAVFLELFSKTPSGLDRDIEGALEEMFWAVEEYVADPELREPGDLDDLGLLAAAQASLKRLPTT